MKSLCLAILLCAFNLVNTAFAEEKKPSLGLLAEWLTGSFSSQEQAESDSAYFDIRLHMVPIWKERSDGIWLYIEQAVAGNTDHPYRQRVYRLTTQEDGRYRSDVYTFEDPTRFAGAWKDETPLSDISPDSLILREDCSIIMEYDPQNEAFGGGTVGKDCESSLRGASYATSEVTITETTLTSWDRGFDSQDNQAWGAEKGGYIFKRMPNPKGMN